MQQQQLQHQKHQIKTHLKKHAHFEKGTVDVGHAGHGTMTTTVVKMTIVVIMTLVVKMTITTRTTHILTKALLMSVTLLMAQ